MMIMAVVGYALVRLHALKQEDSRVLSVLLIRVLQPCLILRAFQIELTPDRMQGFLFALYTLVGFVANFKDLYFDKGFQALGVLVFEHVKRFVFHFADTENADHRFSFPVQVIIVNIFH